MNTLVSVAHTGGQGKTTVAQLLYLAAKRFGQNYTIVAADFLDVALSVRGRSLVAVRRLGSWLAMFVAFGLSWRIAGVWRGLAAVNVVVGIGRGRNGLRLVAVGLLTSLIVSIPGTRFAAPLATP